MFLLKLQQVSTIKLPIQLVDPDSSNSWVEILVVTSLLVENLQL